MRGGLSRNTPRRSTGGDPKSMRSGTPQTAGPAVIAMVLALSLAGCVQPVRRVTVDNSFVVPDAGRAVWRRVAVLPFTGEPAFRRPASEWFSFRLRRQGLFDVVDPSLAEIELKKNGILFAEAATAVEVAQEAGRLLGVDGVAFGSVEAASPAAKERPAVGVSVLDMATGRVVAGGVHGYITWSSDVEVAVIAAVASIGEDLAPVFYAAAGKTWTPPPGRDAGGTQGSGRESGDREPALR